LQDLLNGVHHGLSAELNGWCVWKGRSSPDLCWEYIFCRVSLL